MKLSSASGILSQQKCPRCHNYLYVLTHGTSTVFLCDTKPDHQTIIVDFPSPEKRPIVLSKTDSKRKDEKTTVNDVIDNILDNIEEDTLDLTCPYCDDYQLSSEATFKLHMEWHEVENKKKKQNKS